MEHIPLKADILDFNPASTNIRALRASLRSLNDDDRLQACRAIEGEIHFQRRQSEWLVAMLEKVIIQECSQHSKIVHTLLDIDYDAEQWERFIDTARSKIKLSKRCLDPLTKTAEHWGMNKVQYYEWASMGWKYCNLLSEAAARNPVWEEARVKLNQLLLRRIAEGRSLRTTPNPIYLLELQNLLAWPDKNGFKRKGRSLCTLEYDFITEVDIPNGYTFDKFGLI
ncbi:hypothetical protein BKA63DRAFT_588140, partial [Paraphoma chrysanthemicola]